MTPGLAEKLSIIREWQELLRSGEEISPENRHGLASFMGHLAEGIEKQDELIEAMNSEMGEPA